MLFTHLGDACVNASLGDGIHCVDAGLEEGTDPVAPPLKTALPLLYPPHWLISFRTYMKAISGNQAALCQVLKHLGHQ